MEFTWTTNVECESKTWGEVLDKLANREATRRLDCELVLPPQLLPEGTHAVTTRDGCVGVFTDRVACLDVDIELFANPSMRHWHYWQVAEPVSFLLEQVWERTIGDELPWLEMSGGDETIRILVRNHPRAAEVFKQIPGADPWCWESSEALGGWHLIRHGERFDLLRVKEAGSLGHPEEPNPLERLVLDFCKNLSMFNFF